ncbi:MAG: hypothetical protein ACFN0V_07110, partial [Limosilactobacillus fermentum]
SYAANHFIGYGSASVVMLIANHLGPGLTVNLILSKRRVQKISHSGEQEIWFGINFTILRRNIGNAFAN